MLIENIKEAFQNLVSNRMRSVLTMLDRKSTRLNSSH